MATDHEFEAMFTTRYSEVAGFVARRVGPDGAADVVAEVFLTAWRRWPDRPPNGERIWLLAIAHRVLANEYRRQARAARLIDRIRHESSAGEVGSADVADALYVRDLLELLPWPDQEALRLTYWDGLDTATAARIVGCTATTFRVRLHRARQRFERAVARTDSDAAQILAARSRRT